MNPGDNVPNTLKAEFGEEALNSIEATQDEKIKISAEIDKLFANGLTVSLLRSQASHAFSVQFPISLFLMLTSWSLQSLDIASN